MATAIALEEATPRKSYRGPDGAVRQTINVVENLSLRFDRAFYSSDLVLQVAEQIGGKEATDLRVRLEKEMGLSQITEFWGYHGTYAQEPSQQI